MLFLGGFGTRAGAITKKKWAALAIRFIADKTGLVKADSDLSEALGELVVLALGMLRDSTRQQKAELVFYEVFDEEYREAAWNRVTDLDSKTGVRTLNEQKLEGFLTDYAGTFSDLDLDTFNAKMKEIDERYESSSEKILTAHAKTTTGQAIVSAEASKLGAKMGLTDEDADRLETSILAKATEDYAKSVKREYYAQLLKGLYAGALGALFRAIEEKFVKGPRRGTNQTDRVNLLLTRGAMFLAGALASGTVAVAFTPETIVLDPQTGEPISGSDERAGASDFWEGKVGNFLNRFLGDLAKPFLGSGVAGGGGAMSSHTQFLGTDEYERLSLNEKVSLQFSYESGILEKLQDMGGWTAQRTVQLARANRAIAKSMREANAKLADDNPDKLTPAELEEQIKNRIKMNVGTTMDPAANLNRFTLDSMNSQLSKLLKDPKESPYFAATGYAFAQLAQESPWLLKLATDLGFDTGSVMDDIQKNQDRIVARKEGEYDNEHFDSNGNAIYVSRQRGRILEVAAAFGNEDEGVAVVGAFRPLSKGRFTGQWELDGKPIDTEVVAGILNDVAPGSGLGDKVRKGELATVFGIWGKSNQLWEPGKWHGNPHYSFLGKNDLLKGASRTMNDGQTVFLQGPSNGATAILQTQDTSLLGSPNEQLTAMSHKNFNDGKFSRDFESIDLGYALLGPLGGRDFASRANYVGSLNIAENGSFKLKGILLGGEGAWGRVGNGKPVEGRLVMLKNGQLTRLLVGGSTETAQPSETRISGNYGLLNPNTNKYLLAVDLSSEGQKINVGTPDGNLLPVTVKGDQYTIAQGETVDVDGRFSLRQSGKEAISGRVGEMLLGGDGFVPTNVGSGVKVTNGIRGGSYKDDARNVDVDATHVLAKGWITGNQDGSGLLPGDDFSVSGRIRTYDPLTGNTAYAFFAEDGNGFTTVYKLDSSGLSTRGDSERLALVAQGGVLWSKDVAQGDGNGTGTFSGIIDSMTKTDNPAVHLFSTVGLEGGNIKFDPLSKMAMVHELGATHFTPGSGTVDDKFTQPDGINFQGKIVSGKGVVVAPGGLKPVGGQESPLFSIQPLSTN